MKESFCNSDHSSWKKGEHGKSRSEKKPLQVVDIDRKVEEEEQQGEDNDLGTSETTRPSILCVTQKRAFMPLYIVLGQ